MLESAHPRHMHVMYAPELGRFGHVVQFLLLRYCACEAVGPVMEDTHAGASKIKLQRKTKMLQSNHKKKL